LVFSHADADHHKKKHKDKSAELTQCTIQSSKGGMGCVAPLKRVCEKLKNGKSCCACVGDKNAQAPAQALKPDQICCAVMVGAHKGPVFCNKDGAEAEREANSQPLTEKTGVQCLGSCINPVNGGRVDCPLP
jgi:hypothetical protein